MTTRQTPDAVREAANVAAFLVIHGADGNPFDNPETFDLACQVADAVIAALDSRADHDRRIYEQGRRDACEDNDIALDSRAGDAGEGRFAMSPEWCLKMADLERGHEVGAGLPDHPLRVPGEVSSSPTPAPAVDAVPAGEVERPSDDILLPHLPESIEAAKRCGIQQSDWIPGWFVPWSPRNDNQNAEGPWSDWVALANAILDADAAARAALSHGEGRK